MSGELKALNAHIETIRALIETSATGKCDSGTGGCKLEFDSRRAAPALNYALKLLRREKRRIVQPEEPDEL